MKFWPCLLLLFWLSPCRDNLCWACTSIMHQDSHTWALNQVQFLIINTEELHSSICQEELPLFHFTISSAGENGYRRWHLEICVKPGSFLADSPFLPSSLSTSFFIAAWSFACHKDRRTQIYLDGINKILNEGLKLTIKSRHKLTLNIKSQGDQDIYSSTIH